MLDKKIPEMWDVYENNDGSFSAYGPYTRPPVLSPVNMVRAFEDTSARYVVTVYAIDKDQAKSLGSALIRAEKSKAPAKFATNITDYPPMPGASWIDKVNPSGLGSYSFPWRTDVPPTKWWNVSINDQGEVYVNGPNTEPPKAKYQKAHKVGRAWWEISIQATSWDSAKKLGTERLTEAKKAAELKTWYVWQKDTGEVEVRESTTRPNDPLYGWTRNVPQRETKKVTVYVDAATEADAKQLGQAHIRAFLASEERVYAVRQSIKYATISVLRALEKNERVLGEVVPEGSGYLVYVKARTGDIAEAKGRRLIQEFIEAQRKTWSVTFTEGGGVTADVLAVMRPALDIVSQIETAPIKYRVYVKADDAAQATAKAQDLVALYKKMN